MSILDQRKNEIKLRNAKLAGCKVCPICGSELDPILVCKKCSFHEKMPVIERVKMIKNSGGSFKELFKNLNIDYSQQFGYEQKMARDKSKTKLSESVVVGKCSLEQVSFVAILMEQSFMAGTISKSSGEKIAKAFDYATKNNYAVVAFCAGGGIRIQEEASGLVQMAKIDAAMMKHSCKKLPFVSVLTNPTYGGTTASFGLKGDINIAEPNISIGFGGKMLVNNILHESIPDDFQTEQFQLRNGSIDMVCNRQDLLQTIVDYLLLAKQNPIDSACVKKVISDHTKHSPETILNNIRNSSKPVGKDYLFALFEDTFLIKGDRISGDDTSLLCGLGKTAGINVAFIIQDKGRSLDEKILNDFGMTKPEGYRKAMRTASLAEKYNIPLLILLDSPGAHPGAKAEEKCQSIAISDCMLHLLNTKTSIVTIVTGEACSGGALALSISDRLAMFSQSMYSVISPESYSSIMNSKKDVQLDTLSNMHYTAKDLYDNKLIDNVLKEGDLQYNVGQINNYLYQSIIDINQFSKKQLLSRRYNRIRNWDKND